MPAVEVLIPLESRRSTMSVGLFAHDIAGTEVSVVQGNANGRAFMICNGSGVSPADPDGVGETGAVTLRTRQVRHESRPAGSVGIGNILGHDKRWRGTSPTTPNFLLYR